MKNAFKEIAIEKMEIFVAFVHHKTLTKTGRAIGMSTSGVNNVILSIEKTLGEPLYLRKVGRLILTEMGNALFRVSQEVLAAIENVHFEKSKDKNQQINIAATIWDAENILPEVLRKIRSLFPDSTIRLMVGAEYVDLSNNDFDISLGMYVAKHPEIDQRFLAETSICFYATKEYLETHGTPKNIKEVRGYKLFIHESMPPLSDQLYRHNTFSLIANSYSPLIDAALNGEGMVIVPSQLINFQNKLASNLVRVLPEVIINRYSMFFLCRQQSEKRDIIEKIFELVKEKYDKI